MDPLKLAPLVLSLLACEPRWDGDDVIRDDGGGSPDAASDGAPGPDAASADAGPPGDRDLLSTALVLDLTARTGVATVELAAGAAGVLLEIGDLTVTEVEIDGTRAPFDVSGSRLGVPVPGGAATVTVRYRFAAHTGQDGWDAEPGYTFLWPYFCGNLFPCDSRPLDGQRFSLEVTGVPAGKDAVFPAEIPADAPSYMPAIALGDYTYVRVGNTRAGTEVGYYHLRFGEGAAAEGAGDLDGYVDWLEQTVGPYLYGDKVASVSVSWPLGSVGGMEHHPYWHVAEGSMAVRNIHAHEAAHGWFGNGIRLRCWEDFVLSEGLATYLAARAVEAVHGAAAGKEEWDEYERELRGAALFGDTVAWPHDGATCNAIDLLDHPLWSSIPYYKGAFFLRAVEAQVGRRTVDAVLAAFYAEHAGQAAGMDDLIDALEAASGDDLGPLVDAWLKGLGVPTLPRSGP